MCMHDITVYRTIVYIPYLVFLSSVSTLNSCICLTCQRKMYEFRKVFHGLFQFYVVASSQTAIDASIDQKYPRKCWKMYPVV